MSRIINDVQCPLLQREIELGYCMDIQDVVDNLAKASLLNDDIPLDRYPICQKCSKRIDPTS